MRSRHGAADRYVIVGIGARQGGAVSVSLSSSTINGVSAAVHAEAIDTLGTSSRFIIALVPSGATGRNKLGEDFISALQEDFAQHGPAVIEAVCENKPHEYLKIIASILPKELNIKTNPLEELSDHDF